MLQLQNKDKFEKMIHTAAILTEVLMEYNIKPIVVGGLSVEIYSMNGYMTHDLGFVLNGLEQTKMILQELEFEKVGKDWIHPKLGISLEIPSNELTGDYGKVTELLIGEKTIYVIGLEDIILDRLRSAIHWQSGVDREWGYRLFIMYFEQLDIAYMRSTIHHPKELNELQLWIKKTTEDKGHE